jgi:general secretion pathway protein F
MPVYEYRALDPSGRKASGVLDAESPASAAQRLRNSGLFPSEIRETSSGKGSGVGVSMHPGRLFSRVKASELAAATRQLSILIGSGVPLVGCLEVLVSQNPNHELKRVISQVKDRINEGGTLAEALSMHPKVFSPMYVSMVEAGETSGSLDLVLERLADITEQREAMRARLRAALAYPLFMSLVGIAVVFFLLAFIVPNITTVFSEMRRSLPPATSALLAVSGFLRSWWWLLLGATIGSAIVMRRIVATGAGRRNWDRLRLVVPVFGKIYHKVLLARFGRTLGTLLAGGVRLIPALQIVRGILDNCCFQVCIDGAVEEIKAGSSLAGSLGKSKWFPPLIVQMIQVGEKSGDLEQMLNRSADSYEREAESVTMAVTSLLEPIMILVMGAVVGFIVISILLPIFEMSRLIR